MINTTKALIINNQISNFLDNLVILVKENDYQSIIKSVNIMTEEMLDVFVKRIYFYKDTHIQSYLSIEKDFSKINNVFLNYFDGDILKIDSNDITLYKIDLKYIHLINFICDNNESFKLKYISLLMEKELKDNV